MLRVVELFAGIGAQAAALDLIGAEWESVGIVEIDPYCVTAYNAIHGTDYKPSDITKVERLPECDLLTYSFPCTDISNAGKQKGFAEGSGTRSSLLWEVRRLLRAYTENGGGDDLSNLNSERVQRADVCRAIRVGGRGSRDEKHRWDIVVQEVSENE